MFERERMEESGWAGLDSALQFGTPLDRSKSKLTIPIATAAAPPPPLPPPPPHLPSSVSAPPSYKLSFGSWQSQSGKFFGGGLPSHPIPHCIEFLFEPFFSHSYSHNMRRYLWLCRRHQTTPLSRCGPPTGSRVPLLVPSLICCISYLGFGVTNKKTLQDTVRNRQNVHP